MELTGVEPVSKLGINIPFIHRLSLSDPQGGNCLLSRTMGFSGDFLCQQAYQRQLANASVGVLSIAFNGVRLKTLEP